MDISQYQPYEGVCPNCGAIWGMEELDNNHCGSCGYPDDFLEWDDDEVDFFVDEDECKRLESEAFGGHKDVWIEVDGHQQRVLGDPNMSEETKQALAAMIKAATETVQRGGFDHDEENK